MNHNLSSNSSRNNIKRLTQREIDRIPNEAFNNKFDYETKICIICKNDFKNEDKLK